MIKSLYDISWKVSEDTYRGDPALSYSTLARFKRTGFNEIKHLFDKIETPSLTFGSMVDEMITGSMESFNSRFLVAEFPNISDSLTLIARTLFSKYKTIYSSIDTIPDNILAEVGAACEFYTAKKYENYRVKLIKEGCGEYYKLLYLADNKTIVSSQDYQDACNAVKALRDSESTSWYFQRNNPFENIERLYQLKFKSTFNNIDYRCMADLLIVLHDEKKIIPIDLKTSGKPEWDFYKSFIDWDYMIQARLYWRIIRDNMDRDPYFKDFTLEDYRFIVVNRRTLIPLVWEYEDTTKVGTLIYGKQKNIECLDPFDIGYELNSYLDYDCIVPNGIDTEEPNSLTYWLDKL